MLNRLNQFPWIALGPTLVDRAWILSFLFMFGVTVCIGAHTAVLLLCFILSLLCWVFALQSLRALAARDILAFLVFERGLLWERGVASHAERKCGSASHAVRAMRTKISQELCQGENIRQTRRQNVYNACCDQLLSTSSTWEGCGPVLSRLQDFGNFGNF